MRTCLAIAHSKSWALAQAYDELCRREWHARAKRGECCLMCCWGTPLQLCFALCAGDQDFDVNVASMRKDSDVYERVTDAQSHHSAQSSGTKQGRNFKSNLWAPPPIINARVLVLRRGPGDKGLPAYRPE